MAFYYLRNDGVATGDSGRESVARTGAWNTDTSTYYGSLDLVLGAATTPTAGDYILWSDASAENIASRTDEVPEGVMVVCVDDTNQDQYIQAANFLVDASGDYTIRPASTSTGPASYVEGISYSGNNGLWLMTSGTSYHHQRNCVLDHSGEWQLRGYMPGYVCRNLDISCNHIHVAYNASLIFLGGKVTASGARCVRIGANAGWTIFNGVDFSASSPTTLFEFSSGSTQGAWCIADCCVLPANWTVTNIAAGGARAASIIGCDSPYQLVHVTPAGTIDMVTNVYYTNHETFDDGVTKGSLEYTTTSSTSKAQVLTLSHGMLLRNCSAVNTEAATKKKVRMRFCTAAGDTLDSSDIEFDIGYVRSTGLGSEWVNYRVLPMQATALQTETGAWTGPGLGTQYFIDIDLGNPNNGLVQVVPGVSKPDVTVYFAWQPEFVA